MKKVHAEIASVHTPAFTPVNEHIQESEAVIEESFSIEEKEKELIIKALEKNTVNGNLAAKILASLNVHSTGN